MLLPWILLIPSYQPLIIRYWDINWTLLMVVPILISLTMISSVLCPLQIFRIETQAFFFFFFFFILQKKLLYSKRQILSVFFFFFFSSPFLYFIWIRFRFVAGVIKHDRFPAFEKVLWRLFHENFLLRHAEIQQHPEVRNESRFTTVLYPNRFPSCAYPLMFYSQSPETCLACQVSACFRFSVVYLRPHCHLRLRFIILAAPVYYCYLIVHQLYYLWLWYFRLLQDGMVKKAAFIICVQGEQVQGKIRKICEGWEKLHYGLSEGERT